MSTPAVVLAEMLLHVIQQLNDRLMFLWEVVVPVAQEELVNAFPMDQAEGASMQHLRVAGSQVN